MSDKAEWWCPYGCHEDVDRVNAEIERLREGRNYWRAQSLNQLSRGQEKGAEIERLTNKCTEVAASNYTLRARLERAIEPESDDAADLVAALHMLESTYLFPCVRYDALISRLRGEE